MKTKRITIYPLLPIGIALILIALLAGCANDSNTIDADKEEYELWKLNGHVEKSASLRGTFCNGEGYKWYYEGKYSISGTCLNGMVFHLPLYRD